MIERIDLMQRNTGLAGRCMGVASNEPASLGITRSGLPGFGPEVPAAEAQPLDVLPQLTPILPDCLGIFAVLCDGPAVAFLALLGPGACTSTAVHPAALFAPNSGGLAGLAVILPSSSAAGGSPGSPYVSRRVAVLQFAKRSRPYDFDFHLSEP